MTSPDAPDPRRPLRDAARVSRVLGALLILAGIVCVSAVLVRTRGGLSALHSTSIFAGFTTVLFFGPGILYLVCASYIKRAQRWAAILALVIAGNQLLVACILLAAAAVQVGSGSGIVGIEVALALVLLFGAEVVYLINAWRAINRVEARRGFEVVVTSPADAASKPGAADDRE